MKRFLIVRCGALGNLVYTTSVIEALILEFGTSISIDFVCSPSSTSLLSDDPRIDKIFMLKQKKLPLLFSPEKKKIIKNSQLEPYDILINYEFGKQFQSLLNNIIARKKVGAYFEQIVENTAINRGEMQKKFLTNIISEETLQKSFPSIIYREFSLIQNKYSLNDKYIVISPSNSHVNRSGINYRAWDNSNWNELMSKLSKKIQVVIVGAKNEKEFFKNFYPFPPNTIDLVGKNTVVELSSVIAHADASICTDSAVGHISAAVNTPVFVLMGPNDPTTDAPYQTPTNSVHVISAKLECAPCYKTKVMKNCTNNICMKKITVDMVYEQVFSMLDKPKMEI